MQSLHSACMLNSGNEHALQHIWSNILNTFKHILSVVKCSERISENVLQKTFIRYLFSKCEPINMVIISERDEIFTFSIMLSALNAVRYAVIMRSISSEETQHSSHTLKRKCRHFDEIFITGCTGSCHFDNFQCSQWWKFHQNEDISVSV